MASVNKAIIIGNLGRDPEMRYTPSGQPICNITVATSESWNDKSTGEKKEVTEWHRIVFFQKLAEIAGQYLKKGSQVYIEGRIQTRKWQDKDGIDRYTTEIVADKMQMLGSRQGMGMPAVSDDFSSMDHMSSNTVNANAANKTKAAMPDFSDMDEDIPF